MSRTTVGKSLILLLVASLSFSASHASAADELAKVEGTVTLNGQPLKSGAILFWVDETQFFGAKLDDNGKYHHSFVLAKKMTVTILGEGVPEKYSSAETSGLTFQFQKGENTINFELTTD
ncbi:MAG: hypothetical protein WD065_05640 [Planctomycetaceae bacterium]